MVFIFRLQPILLCIVFMCWTFYFAQQNVNCVVSIKTQIKKLQHAERHILIISLLCALPPSEFVSQPTIDFVCQQQQIQEQLKKLINPLFDSIDKSTWNNFDLTILKDICTIIICSPPLIGPLILLQSINTLASEKGKRWVASTKHKLRQSLFSTLSSTPQCFS